MRDGVDRRAFGRRKTCKPSIVETLAGELIRCTVVEISDGGVRIKLPADQKVPELFWLIIPDDEVRVECELVHQQGQQFGARFVRSPIRTGSVDEHRLARRLQLAEALMANGYQRRS